MTKAAGVMGLLATALLAGLSGWAAIQPGPSASLTPEEQAFGSFASEAAPSVVGISSGILRGSGWFRTADGVVVTASSAVDQQSPTSVSVPKGVLSAQILGVDAAVGVAVLQVARDTGSVPEFGDDERLQMGQWVTAIAHLPGRALVAVRDRIAAVDRASAGSGPVSGVRTAVAGYRDVLGAPILDLHGRVVGMVGGRSARAGEIPVALPLSVVDSAIARVLRGAGARGRLGADIETISASAAQRYGLGAVAGVLVRGVDSTAAPGSKELRQGDVITRMSDTTVADAEDLRNRFTRRRPNSVVQLRVRRGARDTTVVVHPSPAVVIPGRAPQEAQSATGTRESALRVPGASAGPKI